MSLLDDVSIVVTPNGYKAGTLFGVIPVPTEGAELVDCNSFDCADPEADWNIDSSFSISGGLLTQNGTAGRTFQSITALEAGLGTYIKVTFTVEAISSGQFVVTCYGVTSPVVTTTGTYTFTGVTSDTTNLYVNNGGYYANGSISNISVKTFLSADMDVTRATAATRVDENGLVNYAQVVSDTELITCGDFECADPDAVWSRGGGWSISGGVATANGNANSNISQNIPLTVGTDYSVTYTIVNASVGSRIGISTNATSIQIQRTTDGTYTETFTASLSSFYIRALWNNGNPVSVDNVSVKKVDLDNVPRIDYTGGGCPHILAEPMRTNNLTASQDLTASFWNSISTVTIVASTVLSPDGTTFGFKAIPYSGNTTHYVDYDYGFLSMPIGEVTYSIFVKPFGYTNFQIAPSSGMNSRYQNFELTGDGVLGAGDVNGAKIEKIGDWYRCSITETSVSASPRVLNIALPSSGLGRNPSFVGNGTDGVLLWGGQIEEGTYGTSYIPNLSTTSGSTVTRNQDIFTRDGIGSLIGQTEGTFFIELSKPVLNFSTQSLISLNNAASNSDANSIAIGFDAGDDFFIRLQSNNVLVFQETETNADANTFYKVAISYKSGESLMYLNGSPLTPTSGNLSNTFTFAVILDNLSFDFRGDGALPFFGKVKQLQVYDTALTDEQLLQLTGESGTDFYESYAEMASALTYTIQ